MVSTSAYLDNFTTSFSTTCQANCVLNILGTSTDISETPALAVDLIFLN